MKKYVYIALILGLLIAFVVLINGRDREDGGRSMSLRQYVEQNLSELSPEPEVLGGTFYITEFEAEDGRGTVAYEDGHNAYVADFTYSVNENGAVSINTFTIRQ